MNRPGRRLLDALLLPAALLAVVVEDIVWSGSRAVLHHLSRLGSVRAAERWLATLPGWAALPLFLIPEAVGRIGELWAVLLLAHEHVRSAVTVYIVVRLVATLLAVFVFRACVPALMQVRWFAWMVGWVLMVRDWALARVGPLRARLRTGAGWAPGVILFRVGALRRWVRRLWWQLVTAIRR